MKTFMKRGMAMAAVLSIAAVTAAAQTYPSKPIRIVIGTPAGGGSELMARYIGQAFTEACEMAARNQGCEHPPRLIAR